MNTSLPRHAVTGFLPRDLNVQVPCFGDFDFNIWGYFIGSVHLQRCEDGTWTTVQTFTGPAAVRLTEAQPNIVYRLVADALVGDVQFILAEAVNS